MYARLLATCCLLYVSIASGVQPEVGKSVVVYLKPTGGLSETVVREAKSELEFVMRSVGTRILWMEPENAQSGIYETLIVADFTGTCSTPSSGNAGLDVRSLPALAHAPIVSGHILPFIYVDCPVLNQFVGPVLARETALRREQLYGRAVGRLLAHEVYHVLAQTPDHAAAGIAKRQFSTTDLLASRFEFESASMAHLLEVPVSSRYGQAVLRKN